MADTVDQVSERLASLENTVAKGFYENKQEFGHIRQKLREAELRDGEMHETLVAVRDAVGALTEEVRRGLLKGPPQQK